MHVLAKVAKIRQVWRISYDEAKGPFYIGKFGENSEFSPNFSECSYKVAKGPL